MTVFKMPLEQVFKGKIARVLDHLSTTYPLDFTLDELVTIHKIQKGEINLILLHLSQFALITSNKGKIRLADNQTTLAIRKFQHEIAFHNLNIIIAQQDGDSKHEVRLN